MDFSKSKPSRHFEDRTDATAKATYDYLNNIIGTYLLRRTGEVPEPEDVANLPRRDNMNVREGLKGHLEAMFEKANRYYGSSAFQPNPGPVGRAAMDHQLTDPKQNISLDDFILTADRIFRQANKRK